MRRVRHGLDQALRRRLVDHPLHELAAQRLGASHLGHGHGIRLTWKGRAAITAVIDRERAALRRIGDDLTDEEITACLRVLSRMLRLLDDVEVD